MKPKQLFLPAVAVVILFFKIQAQITGPSFSCGGVLEQYSCTSATSYQWSVSPPATISNPTSQNPQITFSGSALYHISVTTTSPAATHTISTAVYPQPSGTLNAVMPNSAPLCTDLILSSPDYLVNFYWDLGDGNVNATNNDSITGYCYTDPGVYTITCTVMSNYGCVNTFVFNSWITVNGSATGLSEEALKEKVSVFPNPAYDELNVQALTLPFSVELINVLGQTVFFDQVREVNYTIGLKKRNIVPGLYLLRIRTNRGTQTNKLVIE